MVVSTWVLELRQVDRLAQADEPGNLDHDGRELPAQRVVAEPGRPKETVLLLRGERRRLREGGRLARPPVGDGPVAVAVGQDQALLLQLRRDGAPKAGGELDPHASDSA